MRYWPALLGRGRKIFAREGNILIVSCFDWMQSKHCMFLINNKVIFVKVTLLNKKKNILSVDCPLLMSDISSSLSGWPSAVPM